MWMKHDLRLICSLAGALLLSACTNSGFKEPPRLKQGESIVWHYACKESGIEVEYKQLQDYSAKLTIPKEGIKILSKKEGGWQFVLQDYRWVSADGYSFSLYKNQDLILDECVAKSALESDSLRLNLKIERE